MKNKGIVIGIIVIALVAIGFWWWKGEDSKTQEKRVVKIGAILPLTGDLAQYGESGKQGLTIAVEEFKEKHKDFAFDMIIEDDKGSVKTALSAINKLASNDVSIVVGAMSSGVTLGIAPTINDKKIILIAPTSTASDVTNAGDYIFRICVSDAYEGKSMAEYIAKNFSNKRVGIVYINNDYGIGLKTNFANSAKELGFNIISENGYETTQKDFRTIINKLKKENIELLYIVAQKEQVNFFSQCQELNFKPQFTGSTMIEDNDLLSRVGSFMNGTLYTYRSYDPNNTGESIRYFVSAYKKKYNKMPDFYAASTYDATKVALYTLYNCSDKKVSCKDFLYNIENFDGVTGNISFDKNGDVQQGFTIKEIKSDNFIFKQ